MDNSEFKIGSVVGLSTPIVKTFLVRKPQYQNQMC